MNIVILGAGAVGGYIGGRLMEAGVPVSFLVRERRANQLKKNGLHINSVHGDFSTDTVKVYTDAEQITECDVVLVTVKSYHMEGVLPQLRTLAAKGAKILPFLNGMEHFRILSDECGVENVIGGLALIITTLDEQGRVVHTSGQHDFIFGALHASQIDFCRRLEEALGAAKLNVKNSDHISANLWKKYAFITAFSGVTTASRLPAGRVREIPETIQLFQDTLKEMKALAYAYEVDLGDGLVEAITAQIRALPEEATASMHQDLRKGLPLEVEGLHGGALRMAKEKGLKLPVIQTLHALLKPYETGK